MTDMPRILACISMKIGGDRVILRAGSVITLSIIRIYKQKICYHN